MNTIGQKIIFDSDCTIGGANGVLSRGMQWRGLCARIQTDPAAKMCMLICDWCEECILLTLRTSFKRAPKCVEHISWHA